MKMKAVSEATGLTDRTIRYYIEETLISPMYTENYLGRKTFDFSESDIQQLNDIAVLRKFGFSIAEIKEMIHYPKCIIRIAKELQTRKQSSVHEEQSLLATLSRLDTSHNYTVSELAAFLSAPVHEATLPAEDANPNPFRLILSFIKKTIIFLITWLPVALAAKAIFDYYRRYQYPVVNGNTFIVLAILILPTISILLVSKFRIKLLAKHIVISVLLILCVLITPINYFLAINAFSVSTTSNHHNYRRFDPNSLVDRDSTAQDLFPAWPEYSDTEYYYYYSEGLFGNTCDIYAEWSLDADNFAAEVSRVQVLFESKANTKNPLNSITVQNGEYTCLVLYSGNPPFEGATEDYLYYIFGYNENSRRVRYIHCYSQVNGADQPYYLSLDW